jgi:hypothetical protein
MTNTLNPVTPEKELIKFVPMFVSFPICILYLYNRSTERQRFISTPFCVYNNVSIANLAWFWGEFDNQPPQIMWGLQKNNTTLGMIYLAWFVDFDVDMFASHQIIEFVASPTTIGRKGPGRIVVQYVWSLHLLFCYIPLTKRILKAESCVDNFSLWFWE